MRVKKTGSDLSAGLTQCGGREEAAQSGTHRGKTLPLIRSTHLQYLYLYNLSSALVAGFPCCEANCEWRDDRSPPHHPPSSVSPPIQRLGQMIGTSGARGVGVRNRRMDGLRRLSACSRCLTVAFFFSDFLLANLCGNLLTSRCSRHNRQPSPL